MYGWECGVVGGWGVVGCFYLVVGVEFFLLIVFVVGLVIGYDGEGVGNSLLYFGYVFD